MFTIICLKWNGRYLVNLVLTLLELQTVDYSSNPLKS